MKNKDLKIGDTLWHPCNLDIIEHKITAVLQFEGFNQYRAKAIKNVGACGRVEVVLDGHKGKLRFVELIDEESIPHSSGLQDFIEGNYYASKEEARLEFYQLQRILAWSRMEEVERLYKEAKLRYNQIEIILKEIKESISNNQVTSNPKPTRE